jgi:hypothetical protein
MIPNIERDFAYIPNNLNIYIFLNLEINAIIIKKKMQFYNFQKKKYIHIHATKSVVVWCPFLFHGCTNISNNNGN